MMDRNKKKKIIRNLIIWLIVILLIAALCVVFYLIYNKQEPSSGRDPHVIFYEGDGAPVIIENDRLLLEMDGTTTQFTVTDKANGKTWYSNPPTRDSDPIAYGVNKEFLSSTLNLTYTKAGNETEMNNYQYSMVNQNFNIIRENDTTIKIEYAIGKIERTYYIPIAVTEERYKELTDQMSSGDKKKVSSFYTKYDEKKLSGVEDLEDLKALYPTIEDGNLYILKSGTDTKNKEKIEGYFSKIGYDQEQYEADLQNVSQIEENHGPFFNASMILRLEGNQMVVEIPYDEIMYEADFPLTYVTVLPMFGAAGTDEEGFIFIPEGSGGVINYNNGKLSQNAYTANLYGWDYGMERLEARSETENTFAVFGMGQADGSFICILEGASSYGAISADIAGPGHNNSFNTVYCKYNLIHFGQFRLSGRTNEQVLMYENTIPSDTVIQRYCFIDADNYVEMAEAYGDYLRGLPEFKQEQADQETPIHIELVGAIDKTVSKMGVPVDSVVPVTTFSEAQEIMEELTASGVKHLNIKMTGWSNGGVNQKVLSSVRTVGELGGDSGMKKLIAAAKEQGVSLYFDGISCFAYDSGLLERFVPTFHAARFTTREIVKLYPYYIVNYQQVTWADPYYLLKPAISAEYANNLISALINRGSEGIAFRDIGNLLSADYNKNDTVPREQVKQMNIETLKKAQDEGLKISIKKGNDYAIAYADLITDMNLSGWKYAIIDQAVPFYQIALHGLRNYTGEAINLAGDYRNALLECAEYGAGLNFTFMKADTKVVQDSAYSCYTAGAYDRWKDEALSMILRYQAEMSGLNSLRITDHQIISSEVHLTIYEDGTRVYVNYGTEEYKDGSVTVPARDYIVERGSAQ